MATLESIAADVQALQKDLKSLRKMVRKVLGDIEDPTGEKKAARTQNNGFNKPQQVSEALHKFLNLPAGEMISRAQVNKAISNYVTEKGLKNGQKISLDATLKDLLNPPEDAQITFLNIQKYINHHYIKEPKEVKPKAAPASTPAPAEAPKEKKSRPKVEKKAA